MSHRSLSIDYSEKLDTYGDGCLPETQAISILFLNYLKTQSISESDTLRKSKEYLKKLQTAIVILIWYESIAFFGCITILIISQELQLIQIAIGLFIKLLIYIGLSNSTRKQKKYIGMKSTITRKIFLNFLLQNININPENRVEIRLVDQTIACKLTFKQIFKEFVKLHIKSIIIILLITLAIYITYFEFILSEFNVNKYLIFSEFALITLPLTLILITLISILVFIGFTSLINVIHLIMRAIIKIIVSIPGVLISILKILRIKKEKHFVLMKYIHNQFTQKDNCSICLCSIQNQGILLPCKHLFHIKCIEKWFFQNNSCPICRQKITNKNENQEQ
ncbi:unnamed protein product [Paramecium pentaurelia]|uniref:RING-type E3 ubiquitin transferase n=1 Tax=Paramecium pentaurelia TaxID=43138 RepID=A0A8S1SK13_9CILI|nr:unnamed protein product [Paramecium pentaurelia]